jgi:hypothetical protein
LPKYFESLAMELRKLIKKQYAVVSETDFARRRNRTPAHEASVADRVMRCPVRPTGEERLAARKFAHRAINASRLDGFLGSKTGKDSRHTLGEHCLSGTRRANHQKIMVSSSRERERPLCHFLATHVSEVNLIAAELIE